MKNSDEKYKLITNNCVQKTMQAFMKSDKRFKYVMFGLNSSINPTEAAIKVSLLPSKKSRKPIALMIYNLFLQH